MTQNELNSFIYRILAQNGTWMTFHQLDAILAREAKEWSEFVRQSYLRGELGHMIRSGQVLRDPKFARYKVSDDVNLF